VINQRCRRFDRLLPKYGRCEAERIDKESQVSKGARPGAHGVIVIHRDGTEWNYPPWGTLIKRQVIAYWTHSPQSNFVKRIQRRSLKERKNKGERSMRKSHAFAAALLLAITLSGRLGRAQDAASLLVVPSNVTMLVGETHTFRAVGRDGRMLQNIHWTVSPESAATLTIDGSEATLLANQISSTVILTAHGAGGSAEARIEIRPGTSLHGIDEVVGQGTPRLQDYEDHSRSAQCRRTRYLRGGIVS